jgi:hypothetical protein
MHAERAREIAGLALRIDAAHEGSERKSFLASFGLECSPEFRLQRDTRAMSRDRKGALFHQLAQFWGGEIHFG